MRRKFTFRPKRDQRFFFGKDDFVDKVLMIVMDGLEKTSGILNGEVSLMLEYKEWHGTGMINQAGFIFESRFVSGEVIVHFWTASSTSGQIERVVLKITKTKGLKVKFT